jgi:hypothetical protein
MKETVLYLLENTIRYGSLEGLKNEPCSDSMYTGTVVYIYREEYVEAI